MELVNELYANEAKISPAAMGQTIEILTLMLAPFAPYLAQELWEEQGHQTPVFKQPWPDFDPDRVKVGDVEIVIQVNGKVRHRMSVPVDLDELQLTALVRDDATVNAMIAGKTVVKVVAVPNKLVNLVVK
jgi:leucyl-tRNA synthetase